ncbi:hypothetical protein [Kingella oralis]
MDIQQDFAGRQNVDEPPTLHWLQILQRFQAAQSYNPKQPETPSPNPSQRTTP